MTRAPLLIAFLVAILILLANVWLRHELSVIERISVDAPRPLWAEALFFVTTIPQLISIFVSRLLSDHFGLSAPAWIAVTTAVSVLVYGPLTYYLCRWQQHRRLR
jgi:hypothetical protein